MGVPRQHRADPFAPVAPLYEAWFSTPLGRAVDRAERAAVFGAASLRPGERALDVGCGTGHFTLPAARRGARVVGTDPSAAMLAVARDRLTGHDVPLVRGAAEALPFRDAVFDAALCVTVLEFAADPRRAVAEMARVLRPGGRLVVGALNRWSLWELERRLHPDPVYSNARIFQPYELAAMLKPYGSVRWRSALFTPPWPARPWAPLSRALEDVGPRLAAPFGGFLVLKLTKG